MMKLLKNSLFLFLLANSALAFSVDEKLSDRVLEAKAESLFAEIRCVVCTGESLAESNAEMAVDMRRFIRKELQQGKTTAEIKAQLVANYGERILQTPPMDIKTYFLWFFPALLLIMLVTTVVIYVKKSSKAIQSTTSS